MRLSTYLLGVPVVVVAAVVAVANRQTVVFSLDPFSLSAPSPALSLHIPLFLLLFVAVALGALLGGVAAMWSRRSRGRPKPADSPAAALKSRLPARLGGSKRPEV